MRNFSSSKPNKQISYSLKSRKLLLALVLFVVPMMFYYLFVKFGLDVFIAADVLIFSLLLLIHESRSWLSYNRPSLLVPVFVFAIPIERIFLTTLLTQIAAQLAVWFVVFYCFGMFTSETWHDYLRRIKPLVIPTVAFAGSIILSYFVAGELTIDHWGFMVRLLGCVGFAYLACIYCNSLESIKKILWVFVVIGVIQLPIMYITNSGWAGILPGTLQELTKYSWEEVVSSSNTVVFRYPGTFGDYELLCEYLGIMVLVCVGFFMFSSLKHERYLSLLSMFVIITTAFYTGTRSFIPGLGIGLSIMVFFMISKQGIRGKLARLLTIGILLTLAIVFLSSQTMFSGYIDRLLQTTFDLSSSDFDTRSIVWKISILLFQGMPFLGYGGSLMKLFNAIAGREFLSPHSLYFSMLLTAGYPGLIAILVMVTTPILGLLRVLFKKPVKTFYAWAIVFLSIWIFWAINEIKMEFIRQVFYMDIIFFLLGVCTSFCDLAVHSSDRLSNNRA